MDLPGELGYQLKSSEATVCAQCHNRKENKGFFEVHARHVSSKQLECNNCHTFTRPERGLGGSGGEDD
jgi:cytochrome c553